ncbi:MAG TPA: glycosyltransferase [Planctomycetota bacterium]|nr:glycosyltransferase [Planctomycetota bacterium]
MTEAPPSGRVALVIPTLNGGELFGRVLEMWRAQTGVGALDICCPDSGSRDGTLDRIRAAGARSMSIPPRSFNHGETRNRAVSTVTAEFVILSVQDALPLSTDLARELVAPLLGDPELSATYGRQVPRAGCHPVLAERIGAWAGGTQAVVQELGGRRWDDLAPAERLALVRYDHVVACMRRRAWERLRFEAANFGEDVRWAARIVRGGGRIAFVPGAVVEHSHDRSAWDEARRIYCDHRNLRRLLGLVTVPRRGLIRDNVTAARAHYRGLVEARSDVDAATRERWLAWGDRLALYENWAQYLGANAAHRWWFAPVDGWLRRGI